MHTHLYIQTETPMQLRKPHLAITVNYTRLQNFTTFSLQLFSVCRCRSRKPVCLVPRLLCGGGEPGAHCSRMRQVPLVTCILLCYTKITVTFCLLAERPYCMVILTVGHIGAGLKSRTVSPDSNGGIPLFEAIGELQRVRCESRAAAFSWNGRTR